MRIQVLGTGCARWQALTANAEEALEELGSKEKVEKVTAIEEIAAYRILATPALVVDGKVKTAGRVPSPAEIKGWIATANQAAQRGTALSGRG